MKTGRPSLRLPAAGTLGLALAVLLTACNPAGVPPAPIPAPDLLEPGSDTRKFEGYDRITLKCNIHGWMFAYIHVFNHPYFAVVGADGRFEIPNLPPGDYTVKVWHEKTRKNLRASEFSADVTVGEGETKTLDDFVFEGR